MSPATAQTEMVASATHTRLVTIAQTVRVAQDSITCHRDLDSASGRAALAHGVVQLGTAVLELAAITNGLVAWRSAAEQPAPPDPGSILAAWRQVAELVDQDMTATASVVGAVAGLVEQAKPAAPGGDS